MNAGKRMLRWASGITLAPGAGHLSLPARHEHRPEAAREQEMGLA
ncbi:hypothetical protein [Microtetraspora malaysiensis]